MTEMYEKITTHIEDAKARQVWQFQEKQNFDDLIEIYANRIQKLENLIYDLLIFRAISTASGVQLDFLGELVDLERNNKTDEQYRPEIASAISKKRKAGQVNVLLANLKLLSGIQNIALLQAFPGHVIMTIYADSFDDIENQTIIAETMDKIKAGGINLDIGIQLNSNPFLFSESLSGGNSGEGFATLLDGSDGGIFARLLEI